MPYQKLPLTSTTMIAGALPTDVKVVETRRPSRPAEDDAGVHVQITRGPVGVQLFGTLRELQLVGVMSRQLSVVSKSLIRS
jgi:hypothetical protein